MKKVIAVDYDGTITRDGGNFPGPGKVKEGAIEVLLEMQKKYDIALWTCRNGNTLKVALRYLEECGFKPDYVNSQPLTTGSPKIIARAYIDDMAFPYIASDNEFWTKHRDLLLNL